MWNCSADSSQARRIAIPRLTMSHEVNALFENCFEQFNGNRPNEVAVFSAGEGQAFYGGLEHNVLIKILMQVMGVDT